MEKNRSHMLIPALFIIIGLIMGYPPATARAQERCEKWAAKMVSIQGVVQVRRAGETAWVSAKLNETYCPGDTVRTLENSRAVLLLPNETYDHLDQDTAMTFNGIEKDRISLLGLIKGAFHFFSRTPRALKVATPFVNGTVEGTEFFVEVAPDHTLISVFQGNVLAANDVGSLNLASGQSAIARAGEAPKAHIVTRPRDAVQWAIYYPAVIDYRPTDFPGEEAWQGMVRQSTRHYRDGDLAAAFSSLDSVPETIPDPRFYTYRAGLFLTVGRVDEASDDIDRSLETDPANSQAFALRSIIAVAQNRKDEALELASRSVNQDPDSSAAKVALSYAYQANFQIQAALETLQEVVALSPENALAWARLSELWMSVGDLDKAFEAAQKGADLNPNLAHTQTVLGFAFLAQIKIEDAKAAFEKAISLDQAAPLPRLGLGLAKIREGDLEPGRGDIEMAVCLDPNNSLMRSYLGKAFFDEKRDKHSDGQFAIAKELDPNDPTPWFYDAIRKQTLNRPVEALHDLQKSIELNDNRAVYRSRLLLDEDLAARSASLGRIYNDLGFQQLALVEGWKSVNADPSNYSAHRFLADSYSALPRHEIARVSELLQSQLLQPINITPVQPSLAESDLLILEGAGPADPSFNEFNPLFHRNRLAFQASGIAGGNDTMGGEVVQSGVFGKVSYSIGALQYETDGFRQNNDLDREIYSLFTQASLSHKTSVQLEYRYTDIKKGDLQLRFDPDDFSDAQRQEELKRSLRLGLKHSFTPNSDLIVSFVDGKWDDDLALEFLLPFPPAPIGPGDVDMNVGIDSRLDGYMAEAQHLLHSTHFHIISGIGYANIDYTEREIVTYEPQSPDWGLEDDISPPDNSRIDQANLYLYTQIKYPENVIFTIGGSADYYKNQLVDHKEFNPKFGVIWKPFPDTTLRGSVFRMLNRTLLFKQTVEPTQIAGFNQFFDYVGGTKSWRYGAAVDQTFFELVYTGVEFAMSRLNAPFENPAGDPDSERWKEKMGSFYAYWTPHDRLALSAEYQFERFDRTPYYSGVANLVEITTHRLPLGISFFHPLGLSARLKATYVDQNGEFGNSSMGVVSGDDEFWVVDASVSYRLPRRLGLITLEAKNLFDEEFLFQDTDPANPQIYPERIILGKFTLAF